MEFVKNLITNKKRLNILNAAAIGLVALIFLIFFPMLEADMLGKARQNEKEITEIYGASFVRAFNEELAFLRLMGDELGRMKLNSVGDIRAALKEFNDPTGFDLLRFAKDDGIAYGTEEDLDRFVTGQQSYVNSLEGEETVSEELISVKDQFSAIIFSVPVYSGEKIVGVLFGYVYGDGFSRIIDEINPDNNNLLLVDGAMEIIGRWRTGIL